MISTLLGKKIGMTQIFDSAGLIVPVTIVEVEDAIVVDKKTVEKDGYEALQIGFFEVKKPKNVSKPIKGLYKNEKNKKDLPFKKVLKEIKVEKDIFDATNIGDVISIENFSELEGKFVDISGLTKGKGFQGVMKRHGFHGGPGGHGSNHHRAPGSVGASSFPSRVFKGHKMGGHMGNDKSTTMNLKVVKVDKENKFLLIKGAVPGSSNGVVTIRKAIKKNV